jgi:hypothetical protein
MFFSADKKGRIFELTAYWGLYLEMTDYSRNRSDKYYATDISSMFTSRLQVKKEST